MEAQAIDNDVAVRVDQKLNRDLLGASDAACALGLSKYKAPITLWRQLRGLEVDDSRPDHVNEAAKWGQVLEPLVRGQYALTRPARVYVPTESFTMDGWLRATPDGLVELAGEPGTEGLPTANNLMGVALEGSFDGLLECKTASAYLRDAWDDGVPPAYEVQVRVEMAVTKMPWCDVVCLLGGQRFLGPFHVERDPGIEDRILTDLAKFWEMVKRGVEPSPDHTAAWRDHVSEKMRATKVTIQADDELRELVRFWLDSRRKRGMIQEEEDAAKNDILLRLSAAGATAIDLGDSKVTAYKTGARSDWKGYALSLGGAAKVPDQYTKASTTWTLRAPNDEGT